MGRFFHWLGSIRVVSPFTTSGSFEDHAVSSARTVSFPPGVTTVQHSRVLVEAATMLARLATAWARSTRTGRFMRPSRASGTTAQEDKECLTVTFSKDGEEWTVPWPMGESLLQVAHHNDIELEGACEGSLACSTCHVVVEDESMYEKMEEPSDDENDMLDLAFGLTETSRLGCQVLATPELDGLRVRIPSATRNFAVDGFVPKPH